jgi:signal transduction histidine kinase
MNKHSAPANAADERRQRTAEDHAPWLNVPLAWLRGRVTACARGVALGALALAEAVVAVLAAVVVVLAGVGVGWPLITPAVLAVRRLAGLTRRLAGEWCDVPIAAPYRRLPAGAGDGGESGSRRRRWLLHDPATWRDLLWMVVNPVAGTVLGCAAAGAVVYGVFGMALPPGSTQLAGVISHPLYGIALAVAGFWAAPWLLRGYGELARWLLGPTRPSALALRVDYLARTRAETIDAGATEVRRIERDLHDGAQARLVAMGMTLDAAGELIDTRPDAARALLNEARDSSIKALAELRDLIRGIHPPVLADRGLADAIRALALDSPLRAQVASELHGRLPGPVESAAYFAVSELLANVSKHACADHVWIDIRHDGGMVRIGVTDDGRGGADPDRGTGLHGIERRLAAFDGVLAVTSPPGGPTVVNLEIPCASSSPKIFSS